MPTVNGEVRIAHSSDLHVDDGYTMRAWGGDGNGPLAAVIDTAHAAAADILLLTGDIFEHNRLKSDVLDRAHALLTEAPLPVVMLPGNHDPLIADSVWHRGGLTEIDGVHVLGAVTDVAEFPLLDLQIWGRAHTDYGDMAPLQGAPVRKAFRHVVAAHGHYVDEIPEGSAALAAWLMTPHEIDATEADYVALGHWNIPTEVGSGRLAAHYSGSPDYAETINIVRFGEAAKPGISRTRVRGLPTG